MALHGSAPFAGFTLPDGRVVLLVASVDAVLDEQNQMVDAGISKVLCQARERGIDLSADQAPRANVVGHHAEGNKVIPLSFHS